MHTDAQGLIVDGISEQGRSGGAKGHLCLGGPLQRVDWRSLSGSRIEPGACGVNDQYSQEPQGLGGGMWRLRSREEAHCPRLPSNPGQG